MPTYDRDGNLTKDCTNNNAYAWNADGNPVSLNGVALTYDALGREVEIASGSTYTQVLYSPIGKLGLMNGQTADSIRIPLPGGSKAEILPGSTRILHSDWLGSARLSTTYSNRNVIGDIAYAPYGENYDGSSADLNFTGQSQDTLSGLYDFLYREHSPVQGRWISPDPAGLGAVDFSNPQSWNRYAYVQNTPLSAIDPTGEFCTGFTIRIGFCHNSDTNGFGSNWGILNLLVGTGICNEDCGLWVPDGTLELALAQKPSNNNNPANNATLVPANPCQYAGRALPPRMAKTQPTAWP